MAGVRAVVQRVSSARVVVDARVTGEIGAGCVVLVGVGRNDTDESASYLAEKIATLRIFDDEQGKMNRSLTDVGGAALVVSQFTLYGDARGQRRPSFLAAAPPEDGKRLYEVFVAALRAKGIPVETGVFQARMSVELSNDGPVTILLDSEKLF
jgi:D-tyrosyl-tRNA(Tyr) deacylase